MMAFIKHGDGKIASVIETEEMTEEQKKYYRDLAKKAIKTVEDDKASSEKLEE